MPCRIALVGEFNPAVAAHAAIGKALPLAAGAADCAVEARWIATDLLTRETDTKLGDFDGIWCVPNSPYASAEGALKAIQFARERSRAFLGTCGGFQHALLEYARNVLGFGEAEHAESNPVAAMPLIARLECPLVGAQGRVEFKAHSRIADIYGTTEAIEEFNCSFGFNTRYASLLHSADLRVSGTDDRGELRAVELPGHPFFVATLFQPERAAFKGLAHPLIVAFVRAANRRERERQAHPRTAPRASGD